MTPGQRAFRAPRPRNVKTPEEIEALSDDERRPIDETDVVKAFKRVPGFSEVDLNSMASELKMTLLFNGIATVSQLDDLVSDTAVLSTLRWLYLRVLGRNPDPVALASWGAVLYRMRLNDDVVRAVEGSLRRSREYLERFGTEQRGT